jgi:hypothetical protein
MPIYHGIGGGVLLPLPPPPPPLLAHHLSGSLQYVPSGQAHSFPFQTLPFWHAAGVNVFVGRGLGVLVGGWRVAVGVFVSAGVAVAEAVGCSVAVA